MISYTHLPAINAILNGSSAVLLVTGYVFIRKGRIGHHLACMLSAFLLSALFLVSYLTYHAHVGHVRFQGQGWVRPVYFTILISHTLLAAVIVPMVLRTLFLAVHARFIEHRRLARWTLPIWLYVSITGVVIYEMLY
jgi:putative membrane protein